MITDVYALKAQRAREVCEALWQATRPGVWRCASRCTQGESVPGALAAVDVDVPLGDLRGSSTRDLQVDVDGGTCGLAGYF
jgi:hypothetical protein